MTPKSVGQFKSFDGTPIYYEIRGEGRPIILNYGIGCLMNHWTEQIQHFSKNYRVIVYDYRGHHKSGLPLDLDSMSVESLSKDLIGLCEHLEISEASFFAHSFGAQVLVEAYGLNPEIFSNLVFINGFIKNPLDGMFGNGLATKAFESFQSGYRLLPATFSHLWKKTINSPLSIHGSALLGGFNLELTSLKDIEIYTKGVSSMNLEAFLNLFDSMTKYDGTSRLDSIQAPTLIIGGKKDAVTPEKLQLEMHEAIPNSDYFSVPYGSHCTQLDMPDMIHLKIEQFFKKQSYEPIN